MTIYTKKGDFGETGIYGNKRLPKDDILIQTIGSLDELNASVGYLISLVSDKNITSLLQDIQNSIFSIGAMVQAVPTKTTKNTVDTHELEHWIDIWDTQLPKLSHFILPGGGNTGAWCHMTRTICRKTERNIIALTKKQTLSKNIIPYLNRLSDFFFVLARKLNAENTIPEKFWKA